MRVTWVNRSFLDYRVPVYAELDRLLSGNLTVIFSSKYTPERVRTKIQKALGNRAIALNGEKILYRRGEELSDFANAYTEIAYQPGLYKQIKDSRPDVLIAEGFFRWSPAAILYSLLNRIPLVIAYERTLHTERHSQWFRSAYRKAVIRVSDAVCCNGRLSAEYVADLGLSREKIFVGAMAADSAFVKDACQKISPIERAEYRKKLGVDGTVFLYVGQLVERKGLKYLLNAWSQLIRRHGEVNGHLVIVGDGPEKARLESTARTYCPGTVTLTGPVDYEQIAQYYAVADIFVMPTLEDNWSLVVPEAMACGLPILCSKYNGCWPELVQEKVNGITFDPLDVNDTVKALSYFLEHPEHITTYGEASRLIESRFSPVHAARAFFDSCRFSGGVVKP